MSREKDIYQALADMLLPPPSDGLDGPKVTAYYRESNDAIGFLALNSYADSGRPGDRISFQRSVVRDRLFEISSMANRARAAGLAVPDDPVITINLYNYPSVYYWSFNPAPGREVLSPIPDGADFAKYLSEISILNDLVAKEKRSEISLKRVPQPSSVTISFNGIGGLPTSVVDADILKRQQAFDRLAELNFSRRKVQQIFVVERKKNGFREAVVGWRRLRDASGYKISIRDVIKDRVQEFDVGPRNFSTTPPEDVSFYREKIAPLFPSLREDDIVICSFADLRDDALYSFRVKAYQKIVSGKSEIFRTRTNRLSFSAADFDAVSKLMSEFSAKGGIGALFETTSGLTPYPFLSEVIYGDPRFGWALAGINVLSAFERGEEAPTVRSYSYLGAKFDTIRSQIEAGKFFVPVDKNEIVDKFDASIKNFGLPKTLAEILEKTGILFFFDERENFDVNSVVMDREGASLETSLLSVILGSIDQTSFVVNPQVVNSNIARVVKQSAGGKLISRSTSQVAPLDSGGLSIDLLTFSGITRFLNVIVDASRGSS